MAQLLDQFGNNIDFTDVVGGDTLTDSRQFTQNISAVNGEVFFDCAGIDGAVVDVRGTFVATLVAEATINGTDYFSVPFYSPVTEIWATTITAAGQWICHLPSPVKRMRIRASAYTSGTSIVAIRGSNAGNIFYAKNIPTTASITTTGAAAAAVTLTLTAPGTGLYHYITKLVVSKYCAAALTAGAAPIIVTTTNIATTPSIDFRTLGALGESERIELDFTGNPLKSTTANTATTIVCPATTGVLWKATGFYYVGA